MTGTQRVSAQYMNEEKQISLFRKQIQWRWTQGTLRCADGISGAIPLCWYPDLKGVRRMQVNPELVSGCLDSGSWPFAASLWLDQIGICQIPTSDSHFQPCSLTASSLCLSTHRTECWRLFAHLLPRNQGWMWAMVYFGGEMGSRCVKTHAGPFSKYMYLRWEQLSLSSIRNNYQPGGIWFFALVLSRIWILLFSLWT